MDFFVNPGLIAECGHRHSTLFGGFYPSNFSGFPSLVHLMVVFGKRFWRSAQTDSFCFCCGNALGLPLFDILPLALCDKRENLQHKVCDKGSHEVFAVSGVKQRHIQHTNINPDFLCQDTPLVLDFLIIAPQATFPI